MRSASSVSPIAAAIAPRPREAAEEGVGWSRRPSARSPNRASRWHAARRDRGDSRRGRPRTARSCRWRHRQACTSRSATAGCRRRRLRPALGAHPAAPRAPAAPRDGPRRLPLAARCGAAPAGSAGWVGHSPGHPTAYGSRMIALSLESAKTIAIVVVIVFVAFAVISALGDQEASSTKLIMVVLMVVPGAGCVDAANQPAGLRRQGAGQGRSAGRQRPHLHVLRHRDRRVG